MFESLEELKSEFDDAITGTGDIMLARDLLSSFSKKEYIRTLIRMIYTNPQLIDKLALQSVVHPNGFDKIVLIASEKPKYYLRLHIWWDDTMSSKIEDIHNHAWDFSSVILTGALRFQEYQVSDLGEEKFRYVYTALGLHRNPVIEFLGKSNLKCVFDGVMTTGCYYTLSHDVFHRVTKPFEGVAATLVVQGSFVRPTSYFFTDNTLEIKAGEMPLKWFTACELQTKLIKFESFLNGQS